MVAPDTHKTHHRWSNLSARDVVTLLVMAIWLVIPATRVSVIGVDVGACGDCGRNDARIADTDLNMTTEWTTFHSDA